MSGWFVISFVNVAVGYVCTINTNALAYCDGDMIIYYTKDVWWCSCDNNEAIISCWIKLANFK